MGILHSVILIKIWKDLDSGNRFGFHHTIMLKKTTYASSFFINFLGLLAESSSRAEVSYLRHICCRFSEIPTDSCW